MTHLVYSILNAKSIVVRPTNGEGGKTHPFHSTILGMKGRWFSKLQGGAGWVISRQKEEDIQRAIQQFSGNPIIEPATELPELKVPEQVISEDTQEKNILENIENHMKSRRNQKKYHRAVSDNEEETPVFTEPIRFVKPKHSPKVEKYCKQFVQPVDIPSEDSDSDEDSSSEEDGVERSPLPIHHENKFQRLKQELPAIKREVIVEKELPVLRRKHREEYVEEVPRHKHRREQYVEEVPRRKHREEYVEEVPRRKHREQYAEEVPRRKHRDEYVEDVPRRKHRDEYVEEVPRRKHREERERDGTRKSKAPTIEQVSEQIEQLQKMLRQMK